MVPILAKQGGGGDGIIYQPDLNAGEINGGAAVTQNSKADFASSEVCNGPINVLENHLIPLQALFNIDDHFTRPFHVGEDTAPKKGQGPKK